MKLPLTLVLFLGASLAFGAPTTPAPTKPSSTPPATTPAKPATTPAKPAAPVAKPVPAKPAPAKPAPPPEPAVVTPVPGSTVKPGDWLMEGGVGTSLGTLSVAGTVGGEFAVGQFLLGNLPFVYGAAGQFNGGYFQADRTAYQVADSLGGLAALGTLHFGWSALSSSLPVVRDLDSSLGVGVGVYAVGRTFRYTDGSSVSGGGQSGVGLAAQLATQWFLLPQLALRVEFGYYGCYTALGVGAVYKL